jgi:hypothetical protein
VSTNLFTNEVNFVEIIPLLLPRKTADAYKEQIFLQKDSVFLSTLLQTFKTYDSEICVKAIPLQAWTGSEDSRRLRLPDFKIIGT